MCNHMDLLETKFSINHIYRQKAIARENLFRILEADDNEENRFWIYFISAIKSVIPDIGEKSLNLLNTSRIGGIETIITVLINEILESRKKFLFIIEDLHVIKNTIISLEVYISE